MAGKDIRVYEDWNQVDAFGNEVSPSNPVSYARNSPDAFADTSRSRGVYDPSDTDVILDDLPLSLAGDWLRDPGGPEIRIQTAGQSLAIMQTLGAWDQQDLVADFERLPAGVQTAVLSELGLGDHSADRLPSAFQEAWFSSVLSYDAELTLRSHWRSNFPKNSQKIARRMARIVKNLSPAGRRALDEWFDNLNDDQAIAACIALAT